MLLYFSRAFITTFDQPIGPLDFNIFSAPALILALELKIFLYIFIPSFLSRLLLDIPIKSVAFPYNLLKYSISSRD